MRAGQIGQIVRNSLRHKRYRQNGPSKKRRKAAEKMELFRARCCQRTPRAVLLFLALLFTPTAAFSQEPAELNPADSRVGFIDGAIESGERGAEEIAAAERG